MTVKSLDDAPVYVHVAPESCPTCNADHGFKYLGEQRWPKEVAKKLHMAPVVSLWRCCHCDTSITVNLPEEV